MADQLQIRGGTTSETASFTGAQREITVDTDTDALVVHDGVTAGGFYTQRKLDAVNGTDYFDDDTGGGSIADAYVLTAKSNTEIPTGYFDGVFYGFTTVNANTGASTADFSGLGVKNIKLSDGSDPEAAQIDGRVDTIFDSANDWLELQLKASGNALPTGYINGLITSNGPDPSHDIVVDTGECRDSVGVANINLSSSITKQIDADWAEGTNDGGFPSGLTLTADTWYHLFVIAKADGTVDSGWDTSLSATNLLADATDYTLFRLIASNLTDSSSNILGYTQIGDDFTLDGIQGDANISNPGTGAITQTLSTPLGRTTFAKCMFYYSDTSGTAGRFLATALTQTDATPSSGVMDMEVAADAERNNIFKNVSTNELSQIRVRSSITSGTVVIRVQTHGWIDTRGKE